MKKTCTFLSVALFTVVAANAQIQKGSTLIGGSINFNSSKTKADAGDQKQNSLSVAPSVATFYKTNRAAGITINYLHTGYQQDELNRNFYGGGVFLRQYFPVGKAFYLFTHEGLNFSAGKYKNQFGTDLQQVKQSITDVQFTPGLAYGITRRLQLELTLPNLAALNYQHSDVSYPTPSTNSPYVNNTFFLTTGFSGAFLGELGFGMRLLLN